MSDIIPAEKVLDLMLEAQKIDEKHIQDVTDYIMESLYDLASIGEEPIVRTLVNNHEMAEIIAQSFLKEGYNVSTLANLIGPTNMVVSVR